MTSLTHEVADEEFTSSISGHYLALCGTEIAASPMSVPEGRRCDVCGDIRTRVEERHSRWRRSTDRRR
jgi:hypothetical protein